MPLYEYKALVAGCDHCRDGFETLQKMGESLSQCPQCGTACTKVMSLSSHFVASSNVNAPAVVKSGGTVPPKTSTVHQCGSRCSAHGYAKKLLDKKIKSG